jgi:hypothetical protein
MYEKTARKTVPGGGRRQNENLDNGLSSLLCHKRQEFYSRSARRQRLVARVYACGPRPVFEALVAFTRLSSDTYAAVGADRLPIHQPLGVIHGGRR